jgi:hypothetical protein
MNRLINSRELEPHKWIKWVGPYGLSMLPYGSIGILPNPNDPNVELPPDTDYQVIYQDHDAGRTVAVTGWSGADVLDLIKKRAAEDGLPFPPAGSG